jgi:glycosyltransferase involved in cell wall biosynthesis
VAIKGETRDIVLSAGAGQAAEPGDVDSIAATMIEMARLPRANLDRMGRNAAVAYAEHFSFSAAMDRIATTVGKVLA